MLKSDFRLLPVLALIGTIFDSSPAFSQTLFQNSNLPCESEVVTTDAASISCRNRSLAGFTIADFNGDNAVDCLTGEPESNDLDLDSISLLLNRGALGTPCGDQFQSGGIHQLSGLSIDGVTNAATGQLNVGLTDFALANTNDSGFFQNFVSALNPGPPDFYGPSGDPPIMGIVDSWMPAGTDQRAMDSLNGERTMALIDCNSDPFLDAVLAVEEFDPTPGPLSIRLNALVNNGTGTDPVFGAPASFDTGVAASVDTDRAVLTSGDFEGDGDTDVALAIFSEDDGGNPINQIITTCRNGGTCNFICSQAIDLDAVHPGQSVFPNSIESGDFDGNGTIDLVITEPALPMDATPGNARGIHYFSNDGSGNFSSLFHEDFPEPSPNALSSAITLLTTGCFNNDNVEDVAVSLSVSEQTNSRVAVFTSDGAGGVNLGATLNQTVIASRISGGMDAGDFDGQGGDDIVLLADNSDGNSEAFFFMNALEDLLVNAGADATTTTSSPFLISDASCSVSAEIPGDPARFEISWTVNPAAGTTLSNADQFDPTFSATAPGLYTMTLTCRTRCNEILSDDKLIEVTGPTPPPTPTASPSPTPTPLVNAIAQGGCLASLVPASHASPLGPYLWLIPVGYFLRWRRR